VANIGLIVFSAGENTLYILTIKYGVHDIR
jgi:hypothetical protein